jgi:hypothetical protein
LADADGLGIVSYQWKADGFDIGTGNSYTLTNAEVGKIITVVASYTDSHGAVESVTSSPSGVVTNANDAPTGSVTISGTATQGQPLTASDTLADTDGMGLITYIWQANGNTIGVGITYVLTEAEVGKAITVVASYMDGHGTTEAVTSSATVPVTNIDDAPTGSVTISGTATQGQTLTAGNTLADADGLGTITYTWQADSGTIGVGTTYVLTEAEVGKTITVSASYIDGHGTAEAVTSSATSVVANINDAPTGSVTISGTATQGQTLTASNTLADADGLGLISYQWKANGSTVGAGITYVLTEAEVGKTLTVSASYIDDHGTAEVVTSSATSEVANINDAPTGLVTISGTATQGQTLTAGNNLADADGLGTINYQWKADGSNIGTGTTFTLTEAEVGKSITVSASYVDGHGTVEAVSSAATSGVVNVNDAPTGSVTISGTATRGQTLTASNTLADADGLGIINYQWQADGSDIAGATSAAYVLTNAEVGKSITVSASYVDGHGTVEAVTSAATSVVVNVNDAPTGSVTITGLAVQGQTLTAGNTLADADGLGSITYTWQANSRTVGNGSTYVLTEAEVGEKLTVVASYTDGHGISSAVASSPTALVANVNDAPTGTVTISGTATQGQTLAAAHTLADADGLGPISYQWQASGSTIAGATGSTYVLTESEVGKSITVVAHYVDGHGTGEAVASSPTALVANVNDAPTGTVTISGTATQGQTLAAAHTLADADGLGPISYQWQASGSTIAGATGSTYVLTESEVGKSITVVAHYVDGHGTGEAVASSPTALVVNVSNLPTEETPAPESPTTDPLTAVVAASTGYPVSEASMPSPASPPADDDSEQIEEGKDESATESATVLRLDDITHINPAGRAMESAMAGQADVAAIDFSFRDVDAATLTAAAHPEDLFASGASLSRYSLESIFATDGYSLLDLEYRQRSATEYDALKNSLDTFREETKKDTALIRTIVGSAIATSTGLSAGYVIWLLRSGILLSSVLSSLPAWQLADPLAILAGRKDEDDEDDESIESIISKKTANPDNDNEQHDV